jgi:hypothetical protein
MYLNTIDVKLTPRIGIDSYNLEVNSSTLEILALILEFKLASACHITRFLTGKDQSRYMYKKLRRMWQAGLLESFKVFSGSIAGYSVFYMLSKKGLALLQKHGLCEFSRLKNYPEAKVLLSWGLFKHEAQIVELASLESQNKSENFSLSFQGEASSLSLDFKNNKSIEGLTPDYTVVYKSAQAEQKVYTEFERTRKSNIALLNKIQRYLDFLSADELQKIMLRLVFQTVGMEQSFWLNIFTNRPTLLRLNIVTTHLDLISGRQEFISPIYASESTAKLTKLGQLRVDLSQRIKLLPFI